ncbi:hypothetical protein SEA_ABT2GRADUATEX2_12 [Streptomyces phage Abt2graduatex2]|nr:hypothetical protein SEA_ABT2GRADUATEX2_12 [Streptomyces phage Abt2graduatex2]
MACACSKNRARATGTGAPAPSGTYRVIVSGRMVYETTNPTAADTVAARFASATILAPGENA